MQPLQDLAIAVLQTADAVAKAKCSRQMAARWRSAEAAVPGANRGTGIAAGAALAFPDRPARPAAPELRRPGDMPRRRAKGLAGRVALLHALAHIELNAIDLAWDLAGRFAGADLPPAFYDDWVAVADDEARHFLMLEGRLNELDSYYGALPAHDGLWQAALATRHDLAARLAVVPMVLEARGLDVTPATVARLEAAGDTVSAAILQTIYEDEIAHVAAGTRWFEFLAAERGEAPAAYWQNLVAAHFKGTLKPPFNEQARSRAGFPRDYYLPGDPQVRSRSAKVPTDGH